MDLEVVWDGAHRNDNEDLLCVAVPPIRVLDLHPRHFPHRAAPNSVTAKVRQVLEDEGPLYVAEVIERTQGMPASVRMVLARFRLAGMVERQKPEGVQSTAMGRVPGKYAWIGRRRGEAA